MNKLLVTCLVLVSAISFVGSVNGDGLRAFGYNKERGVYDWSDMDPVFGIASYQGDFLNHTVSAFYVQVPVAKYGKNVRINFGLVVPSEWASELTRPEFSISYLWTDTLGLPGWIGLETGAYWAISPYRAWGVQLGLLRIKW